MKTILNLLLMFIVPIILATVVVSVFSLSIDLLTGVSCSTISSHPLVLVIYAFLMIMFFFMLLDVEYFKTDED